jgi:hypothetical protein
VSLYVVKSIFVLDSDGGRIAAKYYNCADEFPTVNDQKEFEKKLFRAATPSSASEVVMLENTIAIYAVSNGSFFCITGTIDQNELMLVCMLACCYIFLQQ